MHPGLSTSQRRKKEPDHAMQTESNSSSPEEQQTSQHTEDRAKESTKEVAKMTSFPHLDKNGIPTGAVFD
jgi:hypothetical protein